MPTSSANVVARPRVPRSDSFALSSRALRTEDQPIGFLIATALANPGLISLAAGLVDYETLPSAECRTLLGELLSDDAVGKARLNYGTTMGLPALRQCLAKHFAELDGQTLTDAEAARIARQIVVTTGSQQLLALLTDTLVDPGDIVITAWPSYFVYTGVLVTAGASVRCVDIDQRGIIPERLESVLEDIENRGELGKVKIVYVVSYHDNPTGVTLADERKPRILDIVRRYSERAGHCILLLEDAAYRELTFEGRPPRSLAMHDPEHRHVALLQTFSKPFAPGIKLGYGLLPADLIESVSLQKDNFDFGSANLDQHIIHRAMESGLFDKHVAMLKQRYCEKAKAMLSALQQHLGPIAQADGQTHWTHPGGGLYVWLTLHASIDTSRYGRLFERAVQEGVLYVPGSYCYGPDPTRTVPKNTMRLSFGTATIPHIHQGIERLARAIKGVG